MKKILLVFFGLIILNPSQLIAGDKEDIIKQLLSNNAYVFYLQPFSHHKPEFISCSPIKLYIVHNFKDLHKIKTFFMVIPNTELSFNLEYFLHFHSVK